MVSWRDGRDATLTFSTGGQLRNFDGGVYWTLAALQPLRLSISLILDSVTSVDLMVNCIGISVKGLSVLLHALSCGQWLHILPLLGGGYRVRVSAFLFHAGVACVRAKAVMEF